MRILKVHHTRLSPTNANGVFSLFCSTLVRGTASETADAENSTWSVPAEPFRLDSTSAAKELVQTLGHEQRRHLLTALHECSSLSPKGTSEDAVADQIFNRVDKQYPRGLLDRAEFIQALRAHKLREEQDKYFKARLPVPAARLFTLAIATGVPYIGFGFLDNFIMISAGESIEHAFGLTLGLSIMAAAALGNMVSDVAGVCFAENIESAARKVFGLRSPKLSRYQQTMAPVRVARTLGAVIGVCVGCILGMVPLIWFDQKHTEKQSSPDE